MISVDIHKWLDKLETLGFSLVGDAEIELEGSEYGACKFLLKGGKAVVFRVAKITPKKQGGFVTLWRRDATDKQIKPRQEVEMPGWVVVAIKDQGRQGLFVFSRAELVKRGIIANQSQKGKLAFRVYPDWEASLNAQATKTQCWQKQFFVALSGVERVDLERQLKQLLLN